MSNLIHIPSSPHYIRVHILQGSRIDVTRRITTWIWPLIQPPSGPARKDTTLAMSSGWPRRSSGESLRSHSICSSAFPVRNSSVAVGPGAIAFTVYFDPSAHWQALGPDPQRLPWKQCTDHRLGMPWR